MSMAAIASTSSTLFLTGEIFTRWIDFLFFFFSRASAPELLSVTLFSTFQYKLVKIEMTRNLPVESISVGSTVAQSIERATPGEEVLGSFAAVAARSLLVGSVSV